MTQKLIILFLVGISVWIILQYNYFNQYKTDELVKQMAPYGPATEPSDWTPESASKFYKEWFHREPPLAFEEWVKFAIENDCQVDPRHYIQLHKDIDKFRDPEQPNRKTITQDMINSMVRMEITMASDYQPLTTGFTPNYMNITVDTSKILPKPFKIVFNMRDELRMLPPDFDKDQYYKDVFDTFYRNKCLRDTYDNDGNKSFSHHNAFFFSPWKFQTTPFKYPIFSLCGLECYYDISYPNKQDQEINEEIHPNQLPWEQRLSKVIWRGAPTGANVNIQSRHMLRLNHRFKLVEWGMKMNVKYPNTISNSTVNINDISNTILNTTEKSNLTFPIEIDIAFNDKMFVQFGHHEIRAIVEKEYVLREFVSHTEQYKCKYMVVNDGNVWPNRLIGMLRSQSLVFTNTAFNTFFLPWFQDGVHYVRIAPDFSDLEEKLLYYYEHDDEAQAIAHRSYLQAEKYLKLADLTCYKLLLLQEYSSLLEDEL